MKEITALKLRRGASLASVANWQVASHGFVGDAVRVGKLQFANDKRAISFPEKARFTAQVRQQTTRRREVTG